MARKTDQSPPNDANDPVGQGSIDESSGLAADHDVDTHADNVTRPDQSPPARVVTGDSSVEQTDLSTVGVGSSIALTCTVVMALITAVLVAGLLVSRWL